MPFFITRCVEFTEVGFICRFVFPFFARHEGETRTAIRQVYHLLMLLLIFVSGLFMKLSSISVVLAGVGEQPNNRNKPLCSLLLQAHVCSNETFVRDNACQLCILHSLKQSELTGVIVTSVLPIN